MTRWIDENAFFVLELPVECSAVDVERQGQKLLGMLELGLESARRYPTPRGEKRRDGELVRGAMAELRDPERRLVHELWAGPASAASESDERPAGWPGAFRDAGWLRA